MEFHDRVAFAEALDRWRQYVRFRVRILSLLHVQSDTIAGPGRKKLPETEERPVDKAFPGGASCPGSQDSARPGTESSGQARRLWTDIINNDAPRLARWF